MAWQHGQWSVGTGSQWHLPESESCPQIPEIDTARSTKRAKERDFSLQLGMPFLLTRLGSDEQEPQLRKTPSEEEAPGRSENLEMSV